MVDKRLQDMHTSQMTESAVNVEFLEAIKKHGPNIITLVALIVIVLWAYGRFKVYLDARKGEAWTQLVEADSYGTLVGIGDDSKTIGSLSQFAWTSATEMRWQELMIGKSLNWTPPDSTENPDDATADMQTAPPMSFAERYEALDDIQNLYTKVIDKCNTDSGDYKLYLIKAHFGLASVAEMHARYETAELIENAKNNADEENTDDDNATQSKVNEIMTRYQDEAAELYRKIELLANDTYPEWGNIAVARRESLINIKPFKLLPTEEEIKAAREPDIKAETEAEPVTQPVFDAQKILDSLPVPEDEKTADDKGGNNADDGGGGV